MSIADFKDTAGAFCPHGRFGLQGAATGPLADRTFAVKDFIDIEGHVTGCGNPCWLETHAPATASAPCVTTLLAAGATMIGKTISDELAYSLNGDNFHYGTPINAAAPDRLHSGFGRRVFVVHEAARVERVRVVRGTQEDAGLERALGAPAFHLHPAALRGPIPIWDATFQRRRRPLGFPPALRPPRRWRSRRRRCRPRTT